MFSQALLNSNRHGEARGALREVQERHEDIKRIERTITELAQLFNEMSILVDEQDDALNVIQEQGAQVETDMQQGLQHTNKASTRRGRRGRSAGSASGSSSCSSSSSLPSSLRSFAPVRATAVRATKWNRQEILVERSVHYVHGVVINKERSEAFLLPDLGM